MTRHQHRAMVDRLVRAYRTAPATGADFYIDAHAAAVDMCPADPARAAGVIAALSPRLQWTTNLRAARAMFDGTPYVAGLPVQRAKAARILAGEPALSVLNGPKERAFFLNIVGDADQVTVDMWAWKAAMPRGTTSTHPRTPDQYNGVANAYRAAAARVGASPRDFQAAVWAAVRAA